MKRPRLDDPEWVRRQYADEQGLEVRQSVYGEGAGAPFDLAFTALGEVSPRRVLEVGGGQGFFAARLQRELGCEVVGVDVSERMVELQRKRGVDAQVGDVQALPFGDGEFDVVFSNAVIEHVGGRERQRRLVSEALRVGRRIFLTTPNRLFPLEVHTRLPFVHWLPDEASDRVYALLGRAAGTDLHLLSRRTLVSLFPGRVRIVNLGLTLVAIVD